MSIWSPLEISVLVKSDLSNKTILYPLDKGELSGE